MHKKTVEMVASSVLYVFLKKEENLRRNIYKIEIVHGWACPNCSQWTPKNILSAQFFSMPDRHVSSYYEPKFLGGRS